MQRSKDPQLYLPPDTIFDSENPRHLQTPENLTRESSPVPSRYEAQTIHEEQLKWWEASLLLKNTGSVARDHLASERTFLAWVRTSLSMAMAGVAVAQLFNLSRANSASRTMPGGIDIDPEGTNAAAQLKLLETLDRYYTLLDRDLQASLNNKRFAKPLGGLLIISGLCAMSIGVYRYFLTQHLLTQDKYLATRLPVLFVSALSGSIVVIVFGCLLASSQ